MFVCVYLVLPLLISIFSWFLLFFLKVAQWVVIADISSSRNRLLAFILPQTPFLIFGFVSTEIYSSILPNWR